MAQIPLNVSTRIVQSIASGPTQAVFAYNWLAFTEEEFQVFVDNVLQVKDIDYTVGAILQELGDIITFTPAVTGGAAVTISSALAVQRLTGFTVSGDFSSDALNTEQNFELAISQEIIRDLGRTVRLSPSSVVDGGNLLLPVPANNRALLWDGTTGLLKNSLFNPDAAGDAQASADASAASAAQAAIDAALAQAAVGGVRISANDTTADNLENKLVLPITPGLALTTLNEGLNEQRQLSLAPITLPAKGTLVDADTFLITDSAASNVPKTALASVVSANLVPVTTRGDVLRGNASGVAERLGLGTAGQVLVSDGIDVVYANGVLVLGTARNDTITTSTATVPFDGTRPQQSTDGALILTLPSITPSNAGSDLIIPVTVSYQVAAGFPSAIVLFQDSIEDAVAVAISGGGQASGAGLGASAQFIVPAGSTTARTYKIHIGTSGSTTLFINRSSGNADPFGAINAETTAVVYEV